MQEAFAYFCEYKIFTMQKLILTQIKQELSLISMLAIITLTSAFAGNNFWIRWPVDLAIVFFPFLYKQIDKTSKDYVLAIPILLCVFYLFCDIGVFFPNGLPSSWDTILIVVAILYVLFVQILAQMKSFQDVHKIMRSGNIWNNLVSKSQLLYLSVLILLLVFAMIVSVVEYKFIIILKIIILPLLLIYEVVLFVCWKTGRLLLFMDKKEKKILETMKKSYKETDMSYDSLYQDIYDRVMLYFQNDKPYLNEGLTITDVAREVYTNKVYLSRAINLMTGKNFCQFVNTWRIKYAIGLFYQNNDIKISDMSVESGFHNSVSFSMAFHLYMGKNPSEWCHMEKIKLGKQKK